MALSEHMLGCLPHVSLTSEQPVHIISKHSPEVIRRVVTNDVRAVPPVRAHVEIGLGKNVNLPQRKDWKAHSTQCAVADATSGRLPLGRPRSGARDVSGAGS